MVGNYFWAAPRRRLSPISEVYFMSMHIVTRALIVLGTIALLLGALSCSQQVAATFEAPVFYADTVIEQVRNHVNQGYEFLDSGDAEGAVAEFAKISDLIGAGLVQEYHTACAYGRTEDKDNAFIWLNKLVANGYDSPENLKNDGDLASLLDDPRMDKIMAACESNVAKESASTATVMPEYATAEKSFTNEEEYDEWAKEESGRIRSHGMFWTAADQGRARIDLAARKLACLRQLKKDDPEFDYGLERVREASSLSSMYEAWGPMADLTLKEVEKYKGSNLSEVNYRAGLALSMKYGADDAEKNEAFTQANAYLAKVDDGAEYYGAAQALTVVNQLRKPDADTEALGAELRMVAEKYIDEKGVYRIISTQFGPGAVETLWPLALDKPDLGDKPISLDDYKGKVLLIDFWATWCGPCRAELPNLVQVYKDYHDKGLEIVSISLDYIDRKDKAAYTEWIDEHEMDWRHTYDGEGWATPLVKRYFVSSIPAAFLVGPDGSLVATGDDCRGEALAENVEKALGSI